MQRVKILRGCSKISYAAMQPVFSTCQAQLRGRQLNKSHQTLVFFQCALVWKACFACPYFFAYDESGTAAEKLIRFARDLKSELLPTLTSLRSLRSLLNCVAMWLSSVCLKSIGKALAGNSRYSSICDFSWNKVAAGRGVGCFILH